MKNSKLLFGVVPLVALALVLGTTLALADSTPSVTTAIHDGSHATVTTVQIGSQVHDNAIVASTTSQASIPTGTVDFTVYPNTTCSGTGTVQSGMTLSNGVAESATTTVSASGLSYLVHYNGQANSYASTTAACESLAAVATPTPTPTATPTPTPVPGAGSISGTVYNDLNRSATKDAGEPLLSGWTIKLYSGAGWSGKANKAPIQTTVSDANGYYSFGFLADGTYSIEEINQPSLNQYTPDYKSVMISGGAMLSNYNFGNVSGNPFDKNGKGHKKGDKDDKTKVHGKSAFAPGHNK